MFEKDTTICVTNLPEYMDEIFIENAFRLSGVDTVTLRFIKGPRFRRNCLVQLKSVNECHDVVRTLNDKIMPRSAPPHRFKIAYDYYEEANKIDRVPLSSERDKEKITPLETEPLILFVSALSEEVTTEILYSAFAKRYPITSAKVLYHADGRSKTCGFVNFMAEYDLQKALVEMQHMTGIGKRPIHVRLSYKLRPKEGGFSTSSRSSSSNPYYPYQNYEKFWQPAQSTSSLSSFTTTTTQSQSSAFDYEAYYNYMYQYMMAEQMSQSYPVVQDDDTEEPIIEDDIEEVNKHFLENNEEFYIALEESRWQNVDEIMDSVSNTT